MKLAPGVRHISEIMPLVLAARGLSLNELPDVDGPAPVTNPSEYFEVLAASVESALAT